MDNEAYASLDLDQFVRHKGVIHLDEDLILIDSYMGDHDAVTVEKLFSNYPVKVSFTVALFCSRGTMYYDVNLRHYQLGSNDVLVMQEGDIVEYKGRSDDVEASVIAFNKNDFFVVSDHVAAAMLMKKRLVQSPLFRLPEEAVDDCQMLYGLMRRKILEADNPFKRSTVIAYSQVMVYNIFGYLSKAGFEDITAGEKPGRGEQLYSRFMKEVRINYTKQRSISFYAGQLNVTPKYLSRVVRSVSGRYAGEWIDDYVILEAQALLRSRKYTVQEIAYMLNFSSQSSFGKFFKKHVGRSPLEYSKL